MIDCDKSGTISFEEFRSVFREGDYLFSDDKMRDMWFRMLDGVNPNNDGTMSYQHFKDAMMKIHKHDYE